MYGSDYWDTFANLVRTIDRLFPGMASAIDESCHWKTEYFPKYWKIRNGKLVDKSNG